MAEEALQAILFDVDGTLAETERDGHRIAFNRAFQEAGLDWQWSVSDYGELLSTTGGKERIRRYLRENDLRLDAADQEAAITDLHAAKTRHYAALVSETGIALRPGVARLVREARAAGLRLAIVTTTTPENVDALLAGSELSDYRELFEVIAAGDVVANKKPAPDIYEYVMGRMELRPAQCLAIEDSAPGLASARAAGIAAVLITRSDYTLDHDFSGAARIVDDLEGAGAGRPTTPIDVAALRRIHAQAR